MGKRRINEFRNKFLQQFYDALWEPVLKVRVLFFLVILYVRLAERPIAQPC